MKHQNFGLIYNIFRVILYPWISRVSILNPKLQEISGLDKNSQVIFVGQSASFIDLLIVNDILKRKGLKPIKFTHGINPFLILPFVKAFRSWSSRLFMNEEERLNLEVEDLMAQADQGENGIVFLKRRVGLFGGSTLFFRGFFGQLTKNLEGRSKAVCLTPTSVFLTRARKKNVKRTTFDIFFRSYDMPGRARKLMQLFFNHQKGGVVFSEPINLTRIADQFEGQGRQVRDKRLRWALLFHLNNEDRAYRGPNKRSKEKKVRKILNEKKLNEELAKVATRTNRPLESVTKEADRILHEIASDTSERVINILRILFDFVWARTLEGLDVHQEDLDKIRELNRQGPVVYLPCHRSHVDYLAVAHLFEKKGLHYPRFAAGDNLSKWPLGPILRRAGAFFIRRSFKGETVFPLVFDAYVRHLLRERHVLIFFMEGGRSRTGKLLHPKLGMMGMVFDAWRQGVVKDLPLVPVTIDYGKVFEGQAYLREKGGLDKEKENLASVIKSGKVLKKKHGVLRLRFGDPIFLSDYVESEGHTRDSLGFKTKLPFLNKLSYRVLNEINNQVTLTAGNIVAGLLLGNPRRGMAFSELKALFVLSVRHFRHRKVELAFTEKKLDIALENALATFVGWETLVRVKVSGEEVVNIPEAKRSEMEYYKNNGLHFILDMSLFCMAFVYLDPSDRTLGKIYEFARKIYEMIEVEFLFLETYPTMEMMESVLKALETIDALKVENDQIFFGDYDIGRNLVKINAHMLLNFLESYFAMAEILCDMEDEHQVDRNQLLKQSMDKAKLLYAVGTLRRMESVNHVSFTNALTLFSNKGWIRMRKTKNEKHPQVQVNKDNRAAFEDAKNTLYQWINRLN